MTLQHNALHSAITHSLSLGHKFDEPALHTNSLGEKYYFLTGSEPANSVCSIRLKDRVGGAGIDFRVDQSSESNGSFLEIEVFDYRRELLRVWDSSRYPLRVGSGLEISDDSSVPDINRAIDRLVNVFEQSGFQGLIEYLDQLQAFAADSFDELDAKSSISTAILPSRIPSSLNIFKLDCLVSSSLGASMEFAVGVEAMPGIEVQTMMNLIDSAVTGGSNEIFTSPYLLRVSNYQINKLAYGPRLSSCVSQLVNSASRELLEPIVDGVSQLHCLVRNKQGFLPVHLRLGNSKSFVSSVYMLLDESLAGDVFISTRFGHVFCVVPAFTEVFKGSSKQLSNFCTRIEEGGIEELFRLTGRSGAEKVPYERTLIAANSFYEACAERESLGKPEVYAARDSINLVVPLFQMDLNFQFYFGDEIVRRVEVSWDQERTGLRSIFQALTPFNLGTNGHKVFHVELAPEDCFSLVKELVNYYNPSGRPEGRVSRISEILKKR